MTLKSITISGKPGKEVASALFDSVVGNIIVAQAVRVYLANQRQGTAKTKTRGEISLTKKKWYRQKGTGGARHGARSAPIFVGGGVSHGPTGTTDWTLKISKPMRKVALKTALSMQAKRGNIMIVEGLEKIGTKTKEVAEMLKAVGVGDAKTLIVSDVTHPDFIRASRNIQTVLCSRADLLNTYEIMSAHKILMTAEAVSALEIKLGKKTIEEKVTIATEKKAKKTALAAEKNAVPAKAEKPVKKVVAKKPVAKKIAKVEEKVEKKPVAKKTVTKTAKKVEKK